MTTSEGGGFAGRGQANYSPYTTVILPVCPSALLSSVGLHQILLSSGMAAKISRPELITINHEHNRGLSLSNTTQDGGKRIIIPDY